MPYLNFGATYALSSFRLDELLMLRKDFLTILVIRHSKRYEITQLNYQQSNAHYIIHATDVQSQR